MRLAARMAWIGTETAFEAAARARALEATGRSVISMLAGTAFGEVGRDHVRISYANSRENLVEALERIRASVEGAA